MYSPMASLLFNTEGDAISTLISGFEIGGITLDTGHCAVFVLLWYFFTITTYGVWVPAGLFLPGIIIGCAVGSVYETLRVSLFNLQVPQDYSVAPIVCAAGAMLSAYTRLTYSLVVIMLETTQSFNLFIPMMLAILVARAVGNLFTRSLYDRALRAKGIPLIRNNAPSSTARLKASEIM